MKKGIIAVDIDGTIAQENKKNWQEYLKVKPIQGNIEFVNQLFDEGYYIVIHTSRPESSRLETEYWLNKNGVKFNVLVMNKLKADVYLDDRARTIEQYMKEKQNEKNSRI